MGVVVKRSSSVHAQEMDSHRDTITAEPCCREFQALRANHTGSRGGDMSNAGATNVSSMMARLILLS
jgi:hypothetical protein